MADLEDTIFSHSEIAEYGQISLSFSAIASVTTKKDITPGGNRIRFITGWRTDTTLTTNTCKLHFSGVRNWRGEKITIVTPNQSRNNHIYPFLIVKGTEATLNIDEGTGTAQTVNIILDYFDIPNDPTMIKAMEKAVKFRFKV